MLSEQAKFRLIIGLVFGLVTASLLVIAINSSLSCVDKNGCLRSWCNIDWFRFEYQLAISNQKDNCPFQANFPTVEFNSRNIEIFLKGIDEDLK